MGYGSSGKGEPFRRAVGEELVTCHKEVVKLLIANNAKVNGKTDDDGLRRTRQEDVRFRYGAAAGVKDAHRGVFVHQSF